MNSCLQNVAEVAVDLKRESVQYGGLSLVYRLCAIGRIGSTRYEAEVTLGDEREVVCLGSDVEQAVALFERIRRGGVTPCTLREVVQEMQWESSVSKKGE